MTKDEKLHLDRVQQLGCIVCRLEYKWYSPAEIHHIIDGNKRKGHFYVLPLCPSHHRGGSDGVGGQYVSRHPYKARFEDKYGQESDLLGHVQDRLRDRFGIE